MGIRKFAWIEKVFLNFNLHFFPPEFVGFNIISSNSKRKYMYKECYLAVRDATTRWRMNEKFNVRIGSQWQQNWWQGSKLN